MTSAGHAPTTAGHAPTSAAAARAPAGRVAEGGEECSRLSTGSLGPGGRGPGGRRELLDRVAGELAAAGCVSARAEAAWLVEEAPDEEALAAMVARRAAGEPLQYVIGWAPLGRLRLAVGPGVFGPRPET